MFAMGAGRRLLCTAPEVASSQRFRLGLQGMEGSSIGIWCAHGEGRAHFPDAAILSSVESNSLAPIR